MMNSFQILIDCHLSPRQRRSWRHYYTSTTVLSALVLATGAMQGLSSPAKAFTIIGEVLELQGRTELADLSGGGRITNPGDEEVLLTLITDSGTDETHYTEFSGDIEDGTGGIAVNVLTTLSITLSGNNTYSGTTTVQGELRISSNMALGSIEGDTTILDGGRLELAGVTVEEAISISGTGDRVSDRAALVNVSGDSTINGAVTLLGDAMIGSTTTSGRLTFAGGITGADHHLTMGVNDESSLVFGSINDIGQLTKEGSGTLFLSGRTNSADGLFLNGGTVVLSGGIALGDTNAVEVASGTVLRIDETETIGALTSNGTVDLSTGNTTAATALTVNGAYVGSSILRMDVVLGGDDSSSDRLIVTGDTSGTTALHVIHDGGVGALPGSGIKLVDVQGSSNGSFVLANGDLALLGGERGISAGSFAYVLRNLAGDWFLQSQLQSFAVAFEALPTALLGMSQAGSLTQRLAGRMPLTSATGGSSEVTASTKGTTAEPGGFGAWYTIRGGNSDVTPKAVDFRRDVTR